MLNLKNDSHTAYDSKFVTDFHKMGLQQSTPSSPDKKDIVERRDHHIGSMCTVFFKHDPIQVVRASGQYLFDENGHRYLDCISNVQHVGHSNPKVAKAIYEQLLDSTCNSRFLNEKLVLCCEKLKEKLPSALDTLFFCNSGSEANDLALRIAYDYTNEAQDVIIIDHAYHGHLTSLIDISPYKFNGVGGRGKPDHVHIAPCPDVYRGKHRLADEKLNDLQAQRQMGALYADEVRQILERCQNQGRRVRAFIMESLQSCGGQVIPPPGYVELVQKYVHEHGALFIADEVQTGFGRVGHKFWAFQLYNDDFLPDIVTMGKPMGNGFPVSALVTKKSIASTFGRGMQYFNTFGGNPVACVATMAVLKVLEEEGLMQNAKIVGEYLLEKLRELQKEHSWIIGDVRGIGLFVGIDLVKDVYTRSPATKEANLLIAKLREQKIVLSTDGPFSNIIKIKPPLCFSKENVDDLVEAMRHVLLNLGDSQNQNK